MGQRQRHRAEQEQSHLTMFPEQDQAAPTEAPSARPRFFLLDGVSYAYRAYYALLRLATSEGRPTNAVFGFARMLRKIIDDFRPDYLVAAFDPPGPTFREERYADYKVQRRPMPEDLVVQIPVVKDLLRAFRVPVVEVAGFEADDVMATLSARARARGFDVYLLTGDKDMIQLVDERVRVVHTHRDNEVLDPKGIMKTMGIDPKQIIDVLALAGDTSDNVPGVPGIGEKTALELVRRFGSLEGVYGHLDEVPGEKRRESLRDHVGAARLSRDLVVLKDDVPIDLDLDTCRYEGPDTQTLAALYKDLEFTRLREELVTRVEESGVIYSLINSRDALAGLLARLDGVEEMAVDVETTSTDPMRADLVGVSLAWAPRQAAYVPLNGSIEKGEVLAHLKPFLESERRHSIGHNIKYDFLVLRRHGIDLKDLAFDTMVAAYVLNPSRTRYGLDALALDLLNVKMIPIESLIGSGPAQRSMAEVPLDEVSRYSCEDADISLRLRHVLGQELEEKALEPLFRSIEMPLVRVLADMERHGVRVDAELLGEMSAQFQARLDEVSERIFEMAGERFNLNSPKQLARILFESLKLPVQKRVKTGTSTDVEVLEKLARLNPLPKHLLEYRQIQKLRSTYVDALPGLINPTTGRIHTSFNQTVTSTGRLSSSNPNLQNIPVRTEEGRRIRQAFIAGEPSWRVMSADYSQIELRLFAHLANEPAMIEAFRRDQDIHAYTASLIYHRRLEEVTEEMRLRAKAVNFGIIYGQQAYGLSTYLNIPVSEAKAFIEEYYSRYPRVRAYMEETVRRAEEQGYVTTICGRRRYLPELRSKSAQTRALGQRLAVNTPIQGSAADLIKQAMIRVHRRLLEQRLRATMILQIHDELIFEIPQDEETAASEAVRQEMEGVMTLSVPLKVDVKTGENWAAV